ncbi:tumor necrosis factor receptor superfamily member 3 isoform X3 [Labeo rohita]|nr:tumor necrosis factor receptor superfamily member 3 isoform X3 [Labeo rohita]
MLALLSVLLLTSHVLPLVQSQTCNERTQYSNDNRCCDKCQPGQYVTQKCTAKQSKTVCETCKDGYYMDDYNGSYNFCKHCTKCTKDHMRTKEVCTATRDTVCDCDKGYRCSDSICQACEKIPVSTTLSTTPPHSTPLKQNNFTKTVQPINDNVWISVSLCYACVCVCVLLTCFILISRHARPCGWIMSASTGFCRSDKSNSGSSQCTEEEEVPMPVQEMCGTDEKLEDV